MKRYLISAFIGLCMASFTQAETFVVDGACDVHFSPNGGARAAVVQLIGSAQKSVRLLAYNFTSQEIGEALIAAKQRGVDVELVLDRSVPTERNSLLPEMLDAGITVWVDRHHKIAHNKVIVVDEQMIETGSFNYTDNAEHSNGENALICPSKSGAAIYHTDFENHKAHSERQ